jgi:hypothetical protein
MENVYKSYINVRETRRSNQEWIIQRHWQRWAHDTVRRQTKQKTQHRKLKKMSNNDHTQKPVVNTGAR